MTYDPALYITEDDKLPNPVKIKIEDINSACFVSIASLWEIGIKYSLGKLDLNTDLKRIFELIDESGFKILPITPKHILTNAALEFHHRDPFDRLILAQAKSEGLSLISKDKIFEEYNINLIWDL